MFEVDLAKATNISSVLAVNRMIYTVIIMAFLLIGCFLLFGIWKDSSVNVQQAM